MPRRDGSGPWGMGPMTGRGFGPCGWGYDRGYGYGGGWGRGIRRRGAFGPGYSYGPRPMAQPGPGYYGYGWDAARVSQRKLLKEQQEMLQDELKWITKELEALEEED